MVESIWWQDGFIGHEPPHFDDEVAEGWIVRATEAGWSVLSPLSDSWLEYKWVDRTAQDQPERRSWAVRRLDDESPPGSDLTS